jgi:hypothetical protein
MYCGRSRYMNVVNEYGVLVTTKLVTKQLHYIPITQGLKLLFLSEQTMKRIRWHKEGKRDSKNFDIISQSTDGDAWHVVDHFDLEFVRNPDVFVLVCL